MSISRVVVWMVLVNLIGFGAGVVSGQEYPNKPIRIFTGGFGGGSDFTARLVAQRISGPLGQQVVVMNPPANILGETVARAQPDGYTLLLYGQALWVGAMLQKMPYDAVKDFSPITLTDGSPNVLVVHPSLPVKSVKELIALAKTRPGDLSYGSGATGTVGHLAAELFNSMAGVKLVRITYKDVAAVGINELIAGEIQLMFNSPAPMVPHIKSGRLRALAVTSIEPSALLPGLPTVAATGLPGYDFSQITGIFAPANTPAPIINRLNQEIVRVLKSAEVRERLLNFGTEAVGSTPEQLGAAMKSDIAKWSKVIKDAGIGIAN